MSRPKADPPSSSAPTDPFADGPVDADELSDEVAALTYRAAVAELDAILDGLDREAIDVDDLARQVRRAADLIRHCRTRITGAQIEVERVVSDLADLAAADDADPPEAPDHAPPLFPDQQ